LKSQVQITLFSAVILHDPEKTFHPPREKIHQIFPDSDNHPPPNIIAQEIVEGLESALEKFSRLKMN